MNRHPGHQTPRRGLRGTTTGALIGACLSAALVAAGCTSGSGGSDGGAATAGASGTVERIPQPAVSDLQVAPESERVDIAMPVFSDPTNVTNPLFPVSKQESVLMLGHVDDQPFRTEVTLLPSTRIIEWQGLRVETLVSQYGAFLDGSIEEVAYDYYAQADDGSVWYFGEDVFDFRDGAIIVTEGTWLAGRDGPAAMIMPGDPKVGDVYRPENAPGFVFEEVTVQSVGTALDGPVGPLEGGMVVDELHQDGQHEEKTFAPGYGEFFTGGGGDVEALALAVPTDAVSEPLPDELTTLSNGALAILEASRAREWGRASTTIEGMQAAWNTYRTGDVPRLIEPAMTAALEALSEAVQAREPEDAGHAAIEAARSSFDLQLRYRPTTEIDLARLDLWTAQLVLDAGADDPAAVGADAFALDYVRDRVLGALDDSDLTRVNVELGAIQAAIVDEDLTAAADAAERLRTILAGVEPRS